jgi:hypothetical protein
VYTANTSPSYTVCSGLTAGNSYKNTTTWTGTASLALWTGAVTTSCPAAATESFGAYIKASAMMVVAVVAAALF